MNYPNFKDVKTFKNAFVQNVENKYAIPFEQSNSYQQYVVLGEMLRMNIAKDWYKTIKTTEDKGAKVVYYFSMEFLTFHLIQHIVDNY